VLKKFAYRLFSVFILSNVLTVGQPTWAADSCSKFFATDSTPVQQQVLPIKTTNVVEDPGYPEIQSFFREDRSYQQKKLPAEITDGSLIEGSARQGGVQPDYRISLQGPRIKAFLKAAAQIREQGLSVPDTIAAVNQLTRSRLSRTSYTGWSYLRLVNRFKSKKMPIDLESYFDSKCGVCRENALVNHFALKAAGLAPQFSYVRISRTESGRSIVEDHAINLVKIDGESFVVDAYFLPFNGHKLSDLKTEVGVNFGLLFGSPIVDQNGSETARIIATLPYPRLFVPTSTKEMKEFDVIGADGQKITFRNEGRSQAERKFKLEEAAVDNAGPDDLITIEWLFHPFYMPLGHTSLRIGNRLYEFTTKGWEMHGNGADSARAFIFNNPFFKRQYQRGVIEGLPPFSIGIPMKIKKSQLDKIESWIQRYPEDIGRPFSLAFNNCNQCMLQAAANGNVQIINDSKYKSFSSVMTFRDVFLQSRLRKETPVIYTLSGVEIPNITYGEMVPPYLYDEHSTVSELLRVLSEVKTLFYSRIVKKEGDE
jgi:hypothetical protein